MKTKNSCYTYFIITGEFDPDRVSALLGLRPDKVRRIGEGRRDGKKYDCASWEFGRCDTYDPNISYLMETTIQPLRDKIDLLNRIRRENNVSFYLSVVPHIYAKDVSPSLAPSLEVIDFCHATRTELDIDLYVIDSADA